MITYDGNRSAKRGWFARKLLARIKDIDVPSKRLKWDGFDFRVWQLGKDLEGGRVTAPMGAVVWVNNANGSFKCVADYWRGAFELRQDMHGLWYPLSTSGDSEAFITMSSPAPETLEANGYTTSALTPAIIDADFGIYWDASTGYSLGEDSITEENYPGYPSMVPYRNPEVFWYTHNEWTANAGANRYSAHTVLTPYFGNNSSLSKVVMGGRQAIGLGIEGEAPREGFHLVQQVEAERISMSSNAIYWELFDETYDWELCYLVNTFITYDTENQPVVNMSFDMLRNILTSSMPEALREILLGGYVISPHVAPLGNYACTVNGVRCVLHVASAAQDMLTRECSSSSTLLDYYDLNPDDRKWSLFYCIKRGSSVYMVNSDDFLSLLDSLATADVMGPITAEDNWSNAVRMLEQFAGAWPNRTSLVPYDSVMFHGQDGNFYVWTREYGAVVFATTGMFSVAITVPGPTTSTVGVRPEISYCGLHDGVPLYICICNKPRDKVHGVYIGSPFVAWSELPGTEVGEDLVYVRPVRVTPTDVFMIGVIRVTESVDGVDTDFYHFASFQWATGSTATWQKMARLPVTVTGNDSFAAGLYGIDHLVESLRDFPSKPHILPQMPVCSDYSKYSIGMP